MAQNWWEQDEIVAPTQTLPERKMGADVGQSEASAEKTREDIITERQLRDPTYRKAVADAAKAEAEAKGADIEATKAEEKTVASQIDATNAVRNVLDKLDAIALDADDAGGWWETGTSGGLMRDYGPKGTAAYSLAGDVETVDAATAFAALNKMRQESPTGGALGNITERELDLLKSSVSNIDPDLDHPTFLKNVGISRRYYQDMLHRLDPEAAAEYERKAGVHFDEEGRPFMLRFGEDGSETRDYEPLLGGAGNDGGTAGGGGGGSGGDGGGGGGGGGKPYDMSTIMRGLGQGTGSIVEAIGSVPGILLDPLATSGFRMAGYPNYTYDTGTVLREALGLPDNPNATTDPVIKGGAMGLTGALGARGLAQLAKPGALQNALNVFGTGPGRQMVAGTAAGAGGEAARAMDVGPVGQAGAAIGTGMLGYGGAQAARNAFAPGALAPTPLAQAAARQGVDLLPADVGGPTTRIITSAARISPLSAAPIVKTAERQQKQLSAAARRTAESQGSIATTDEAGQFLRKAAERYENKTQDISTTMYRQAFKAAGDVRIPPKNAVGKIDGLLNELRAAPETNAKAIENLLKIRRDVTQKGGMTAEAMHNLRSNIREGIYDGGFHTNKEKGRMKAIGSALSQDMLGFFDEHMMPGIANRIRKADAHHAARVEHLKQVLDPILGKEGFKGGEQVVSTIESMARGKMGGNLRLSRFMKEMTREEQGQVRATLIDRIGRAREDSPFSAEVFLRHWEGMTPQAKRDLFKEGDLRRNLDDIAKLAENSPVAQQMASHTASPGLIQGNIGLNVVWAMSHFPSYLASLGTQFVTGQLMASPRFARWLAKAPVTKDPVAMNKYVDRLAVLASREPAIRQDALALQQHLKQSLEQSPVRAAAGEEEQD